MVVKVREWASPPPEAKFLDEIKTKVLRVFLLAIHSHLTDGFYPPPPPPPPRGKSGSKLFCNVNMVYGNLQYENSQDYAQKPQRNCTFMNSSSGLIPALLIIFCKYAVGINKIVCRSRGQAACFAFSAYTVLLIT
jgi:hypothetical protein